MFPQTLFRPSGCKWQCKFLSRNRSAIAQKEDGTFLGEEDIRILALEEINSAWEKEYKLALLNGLNAAGELLKIYGTDPENRAKVLRLLSQEIEYELVNHC